MTNGASCLAHLGAGDVSAVVDLAGETSAVVQWGTDLGEFSPADLKVLGKGGPSAVVINGVDDPVRLAVPPEDHRGGVGRPGTSSSRRGVDESPTFRRLEVHLCGGFRAATSIFGHPDMEWNQWDVSREDLTRLTASTLEPGGPT